MYFIILYYIIYYILYILYIYYIHYNIHIYILYFIIFSNEPQQKIEQCFQHGMVDVFHIFCTVNIYIYTYIYINEHQQNLGLCGDVATQRLDFSEYPCRLLSVSTADCRSSPIFWLANWVNFTGIVFGTSIFCLWPAWIHRCKTSLVNWRFPTVEVPRSPQIVQN